MDKDLVARASQQKAKQSPWAHAEQGLNTGLPCEVAQHRFGTATAVMPLLGFLQPHSLRGVVAGTPLVPGQHGQISPPALGWQGSYCHV